MQEKNMEMENRNVHQFTSMSSLVRNGCIVLCVLPPSSFFAFPSRLCAFAVSGCRFCDIDIAMMNREIFAKIINS
jgi:hypothetical protein